VSPGAVLPPILSDVLLAARGARSRMHLGLVEVSRCRRSSTIVSSRPRWCLTLVTDAVGAWTTEYYGLAVESMRAASTMRCSRTSRRHTARSAVSGSFAELGRDRNHPCPRERAEGRSTLRDKGQKLT
jgi:hypothetical protein